MTTVVDLSLSLEQEMLATTASGLVERSVDGIAVRALEVGEPGYDPLLWSTMAGLGWTELGPLDLALVLDRLGRGPLPSPLAVTGALRNALPALATMVAPDAVLTLAVLTPDATNEWTSPVVTDGGALSGVFWLVPYERAAEVVVVATAGGLVAIDPADPRVTQTRHEAIGGDALYRLECAGVPTRPVAGMLGSVLDHCSVAALAYAVGVAEGALGLAVGHARDRHQFGRPIGAFQAVAHRCADMRADVDACRMLAYRAAWALEADHERELAIASALAYANDALRRVAMHAHQVHGAIGFSTEHDLHLFTRRIKAFELTFGSTAWHQERLAAAIGLQ